MKCVEMYGALTRNDMGIAYYNAFCFADAEYSEYRECRYVNVGVYADDYAASMSEGFPPVEDYRDDVFSNRIVVER